MTRPQSHTVFGSSEGATIRRSQLLNLYRFLSCFAAAAFIGFRYLLPEEAIDPIWPRAVFSGMLTVGVVWSLINEDFFQRFLGTIIQGFIYLLIIWIVFLLWQNQFMVEYTLAYFMLFFCSVFLFNTLANLIYFLIFNGALAGFAAVMVTEPLINPVLFLSLILCLSSFCAIAIGFVLRRFREVTFKSQALGTISESVFETGMEGILVLDREDKLIDFNQQYLQIMNLDDQSVEPGMGEEVAKAAAGRLLDPLRFKKGDGWAFPDCEEPIRITTRKNSLIEVYSRPFILDGEESGRIIFFRDVTESQVREAELERLLAVNKATFESSGLGIAVMSVEDKPLFYNDVYLAMWALDRQFVENSNARDVVEYCQKQLKNQSEIDKAVQDLRSHPNKEDFRLMEFKDGRIVERATEKLNVGDEVIGRVFYYRDITDKIRVDEELVRRNYELDTFVYRASHDLKSPLRSLSGLVNLALSEFTDEEVRKFLQMMKQNLVKLEDFIGTLTDYSRNQRMEVKKETMQLDEILREVKGKLRFMAGAKETEVEFVNNFDGEFYSDPSRISIILTNLISNSIKFGDPGQEKRYIRLVAEGKGADVELTVEDNGQGIPQHYHDQVFQLFFRGNAQSTGSGLGLYVVKNTMEKLGGSIEFDAKYSDGARFRLFFPNAIQERIPQNDGSQNLL